MEDNDLLEMGGAWLLGEGGASASLRKAVAFCTTSEAAWGGSVREGHSRVLASLRPWTSLVVVTHKEAGKSGATGVLDDVASLCPAEEKDLNIKQTESSWRQDLPAFAWIFMIHFFIRKREGALSRYSEPSRRLKARGRRSR